MPIPLLIALAAAVPAAAADRPLKLETRPACHNPGTEQIADDASRGSVHPLGAEPPAKQVLTVMRTVDGCTKPVIVRDVVGTPKAKPPRPM